ncbi:MAG: molybdenum cofactor biosynthesis protein MoaE [Pseudohongiella sp.]|nr:molybdenum cofactor biosynthesis protein MoaE [Pseudohongiella sp.]
MSESTLQTHIHISVQTDDFDVAAEYTQARQQSANPGAIVCFCGLVRDVLAGHEQTAAQQTLTLEHYPGMTEHALMDIATQATGRWPLHAIRIIHRVGTLSPAEQIVLVVTSSAHRSAAFESAEFIMDYLKTSAPFWKKQVAGAKSEWVASRESDYRAAARWSAPD